MSYHHIMTNYVCTSCDYIGKRKILLKGSTAMEIMLWVTLLIPGPFYSLWRRLGKKYICPHCGEETMVDENSPLGLRKLNQINSDISEDNLKKIPDMWQKDREEYWKKQKAKEEAVKRPPKEEPQNEDW